MTTIRFLHTAGVHVATFRRLREELAPGWQDLHLVDPALLADARRSGSTPELAGRIDARLHELADRFLALSPGACVLFMSGYARPALDSQGTLDPDVTLVEKPFSKTQLLAAVQRCLERQDRT